MIWHQAHRNTTTHTDILSPCKPKRASDIADEVSRVRSDSAILFAICFIRYRTSTVSGPGGRGREEEYRRRERCREREKENVTDIERWRERRREGEAERENEIWEDEGRLARRREVKWREEEWRDELSHWQVSTTISISLLHSESIESGSGATLDRPSGNQSFRLDDQEAFRSDACISEGCNSAGHLT